MFYEHSTGFSFRKVEKFDLPFLKELKNTSWKSTVQLACLNSEDQLHWYDGLRADSTSLYLIIENSKDFTIGDILTKQLITHHIDYDSTIGFWGITDIDNRNHSCSFSHGIYAPFRGHGFGSQSLKAGIDLIFEVFNFNRIETRILESNEAEIKAATNAGMKLEGEQRNAVFKMGQYQNCCIFGILRSEWSSGNKSN